LSPIPSELSSDLAYLIEVSWSLPHPSQCLLLQSTSPPPSQGDGLLCDHYHDSDKKISGLLRFVIFG
jgi:hypothetical protein